MNASDVVIVGAGHGGSQAAIVLRQLNFDGAITIVGDEPHLPYERPPLSKDYLAGDKTFERCLIRPAAFWTEQRITMRLGHRVAAVRPETRRLEFQDGGELNYGVLIWAAGGKPRMLACPGADFPEVHTVRDRADVDALVGQLGRGDRVVVVGGGFIGLEAAAVLTKLGKRVVVLEALDRLLPRVAGEGISRFYEAEHRAQGVDVRTDAAVECLEGRDGHLTGVRLKDGQVLPADLVIVGIGINPSVAPILAAGAVGDIGVEVDEACRTSLPNVYAIGDCAVQANPFAEGRRVRIESVQNATNQAGVATRHLMGLDGPSPAAPWFWSDQYDLKLQTVGLAAGYDATVLRGDPATRSFSVVYLRDGRVVALDCVNATRDYVQGRRLVELGLRIDPALLSDVEQPLKEFASGQAG
ncbi:NAD(P)/FAD-dependent oxidoreductase [Phenylobacterium sp.]|jgi:3-phenylpropionate/trans-cinnamate dioxygenase ferredoxin reductase subunit|uniref:NAD(P)/FAD-dependent oxidoreductase n=1 Tax=Phenylobacterium sp. TaxID=1871053 RepID=UPI002E320B81|nr:FAD-dependent oxidoreductase [Phenylobacterium sp.]HEX3364621.1 FAD-dependent oxidoreductase [Phenylobacterium sp.]